MWDMKLNFLVFFTEIFVIYINIATYNNVMTLFCLFISHKKRVISPLCKNFIIRNICIVYEREEALINIFGEKGEGCVSIFI